MADSLDPEITGMLDRIQGTDKEHDAWLLLEAYRTEALVGAETGTKEALLNQARQRLKDALRQLLG